jgi:hypothetical protein
MKSPFVVFTILQVMDILTTIAALAMGGAENNPLIAHLMAFGLVRGLVFSKLIVIGLAFAGVWMHKDRGIRLANLVFSAIVIWNVSVIARLALAA